MIVIVKKNSDEKQLNNLISWIKGLGLEIYLSEGANSTVLGLIGDTSKVDIDLLHSLDIVETVKRIQEPYKNVNRKFHPEDTIVEVGGHKFGGKHFQIIAGPCSVESEAQIVAVAQACKAAGANFLRGGAFKPRTSPYAFQGLRDKGLDLLLKAESGDGHAHRDGDHERPPHRFVRGRGYRPDRRAQHAEFRAVKGSRAHGETRSLKARAREHHRGVAHERGIPDGGGAARDHPLRARHPHV